MDHLGAEVGQKMRSAIKAKLLELNCYVDDELPDYIMVMVANRRTKSQMNEDLNLFLNTQTSVFVEWLHIVLKKLKEVTVTNPEVYKKVAKKKSSEQDVKPKKEKVKKCSENVKTESSKSSVSSRNSPCQLRNGEEINEFDIPLLSEVNSSSAKDLEEIEAKIRNVKSRLGLPVDIDIPDEVLNIKLEKAKTEIAACEENVSCREVELQIEDRSNNSEYMEGTEESESLSDRISYTPEKLKRHSPITFEKDDYARTPPRKGSVLSRLGKRVSSTSDSESKKRRLSFTESRRDESSYKRNSSRDLERHTSRDDKRHKRDRRRSDRSNERRASRSRRVSPDSNEFHGKTDKSVLSRLGVMSKVYVPEKTAEPEIEDELKTREVRSMVQVKPRILPSDVPQPTKNLLLKAVAEAHRSVSETKVGSAQGNSKKSENPDIEDVPATRKLSHREKIRLRNLILSQVSKDESDEDDKDMEYVPKPVKRGSQELPEYVPSATKQVDDQTEKEKPIKARLSAKARLEARKSPSPIIFDRVSTKVSDKIRVPGNLNVVHPSTLVKTQERCKYWPNCKQGDKCDFVHPTTICGKFQSCKNPDKCLFIHPACKFGTSCTKRDCPYSHSTPTDKAIILQQQNCKFFPNCINVSCPFYHPKLCRYGKYCKNQFECTFSHISTVNKSILAWKHK